MREDLVSVAVTTYNSERYILETLNSIFNQTYSNIELIVSDDFSVDNTIQVVRDWTNQDIVQARFFKITILTVDQNTGTSANCNRCIKAASSDWIKLIAGDDILLPNCIKANMAFALKNPEAEIVFSSVKEYLNTFEEKNYLKTTPSSYPSNLMDKKFTAEDQWKILIDSDRINYTPSYFFYRKAIERAGYYNEQNKLIEDYPMWLKLTKAGNKLYFFEEETVGYRKYKNYSEDQIFDNSFRLSYEVRKKFVHSYLNYFRRKKEAWNYFISLIFEKLNINRKKYFYSDLYHFLTNYGNPFFYMDAIYRRRYGTFLKV